MDNVERQENDSTDSTVEQPEKPVNIEVLQEEVRRLSAYNEKLIGDSKDVSNRWQKLRDTTDAKDKLELEQSENWKGLLEKEKTAHFELEEKHKTLKKNALKKDLDFTVAKLIDIPLADGASVDDVIHHVLDTGLVEVSEDETQFLNIQDAYAKVKESKSFLFNSKKAPMANAVPGNNAPQGKKLSSEELFRRAIEKVHN